MEGKRKPAPLREMWRREFPKWNDDEVHPGKASLRPARERLLPKSVPPCAATCRFADVSWRLKCWGGGRLPLFGTQRTCFTAPVPRLAQRLERRPGLESSGQTPHSLLLA